MIELRKVNVKTTTGEVLTITDGAHLYEVGDVLYISRGGVYVGVWHVIEEAEGDD